MLAEPSEVTRKALDGLVPDGSRSANPIDLSNGTAPEVFGEALRVLAADPDVDSVLVI